MVYNKEDGGRAIKVTDDGGYLEITLNKLVDVNKHSDQYVELYWTEIDEDYDKMMYIFVEYALVLGATPAALEAMKYYMTEAQRLFFEESKLNNEAPNEKD